MMLIFSLFISTCTLQCPSLAPDAPSILTCHFCILVLGLTGLSWQIFSKEYINLLLTGYFFLLGVLALTHLISTHVSRMLPSSVPLIQYHLKLTQDASEDLIDFKFSTHDLISLAISAVVGVWYLVKKVSCICGKSSCEK